MPGKPGMKGERDCEVSGGRAQPLLECAVARLRAGLLSARLPAIWWASCSAIPGLLDCGGADAAQRGLCGRECGLQRAESDFSFPGAAFSA